MDAVTGSAAVGACPECGRRYVPSRASCAFCGTGLEPAEIRAGARVLARTRVHRTPRGALVSAPYAVAWLQEEDGGAVFLAPLDGEGAVAIGATVALELRRWALDGGDEFAGVIGVPVAP